MRIALFIVGALAAGYLIIKGFKQMLAESRQPKIDDSSDNGPDDSDRF